VPFTPHQKNALFNKLLKGKLSPQESEELMSWLGSDKLDPEAAAHIMSQLKQSVDKEDISPAIIHALEERVPAILDKAKQQPDSTVIHIKRRNWIRYAAAAAIVVVLGTSIYYFTQSGSDKTLAAQPVPVTKDIDPGKEGAILTLKDGTTVILDNRGNGLVATQNGANVMLDNGQLVYNNNKGNTQVAYNTVTTPRGRQFQLVLSDGTKVWLNAASSLTYPTAFVGKERRVEVTGEVYFEVTHLNDGKPFFVKVNDKTEIQVLGTHFNINSYNDEASINTTLLEGSVKIINGNNKTLLKPGQQAQINNLTRASIKVVDEVDVEKVMAWKNGRFYFDDASLGEVMRQLQRWYDIEVVYEKGVPQFEFIGKLSKDLPLSGVLRGLEVSKVKFRTEGRKVVVLP
jgi:ferric-dicitrate binding protein FerR (iron transport regulator)